MDFDFGLHALEKSDASRVNKADLLCCLSENTIQAVQTLYEGLLAGLQHPLNQEIVSAKYRKEGSNR
ncbi:hypothetical protein M514_12289 [Trichuris suis]|uniref:Uncharacterized protein n=1 Tax=Trichuris suis TaxID=68888 RepID=A0A085LPE7_9BILA|nr:hypothetical protein M513_12289 [Trichuris suis]KFD64985.1 hypothetical protein M514_12289 [Trichuris suis]